VLHAAGEPLHAKEVAKRVLESRRTRLGGKTPEQTITAMLAVGSKPGGPFTRVDKSIYTLAETTTAPGKEAPGPKTDSKTRPRTQQKETPVA
jgi:hypothetical protein